MKVSIIFPVKNEGQNLKNTLDSLFAQKTNYSLEVIVINDASEDQCCDFLANYNKNNDITLIQTEGIGAANARNLGASNALGDYLIFCDAHLIFQDWWLDHLLEPLLAGKTDAVSPTIGAFDNDQFFGFGQTLNPNLSIKWNTIKDEVSEVAILPGACLAVSKKVFEKVGGFEKGFETWGHEDVEFSIKLWLFGYRCHVVPTVKVLHLFRKQHPYKVQYDDFYHNILKLAYSHFDLKRIQKCKRLIINSKVRDIERRVLENGALEQRRDYFKRRKRSDDWYFKKFGIDF
ncbi:glycosyltransferase family 2 protein [Paucisalibacillus sp. EB02]|uniref:glycosyltransferase family 2 protein n=1 Tax=Paucisalibacillus sp. EB02 TaxID=1347087 RepID=UPI0004B5DCB1|nr:glycosyltransferase [Paucisalibacillus sp. EB02]